MKIEKIIHRIWIGESELPDKHAEWCRSWERLHRPMDGWSYMMWGEEEIRKLDSDIILYSGIVPAARADVIRLMVLAKYGGVYHDTDFQCLKPVGAMLDDAGLVACEMVKGSLCNGFMACVAGHPLITRMASEAAERLASKPEVHGYGILPLVGTKFVNSHIKELRTGKSSKIVCDGVHIADKYDSTGLAVTRPGACFPYMWWQQEPESFGDATMVHHWGESWIPESVKEKRIKDRNEKKGS